MSERLLERFCLGVIIFMGLFAVGLLINTLYQNSITCYEYTTPEGIYASDSEPSIIPGYYTIRTRHYQQLLALPIETTKYKPVRCSDER